MTIRQADRVLFAWLLDLSLLAVSLFVADQLRVALPFGPDYQAPLEVVLPIYLLTALLWSFLFFSLGVYRPPHLYQGLGSYRLVAIHLTASIILAAFIYLTLREFSRYLFGYFVIISLTALLGWRRLAAAFGARTHSRRPVRTLIVGTGPAARAAYDILLRGSDSPLEFVGFVGLAGESQLTGESHAGESQLAGGRASQRQASERQASPNSPAQLPARLLGNLEAVPRLLFGKTIDEAVIALESLSTTRLAEIIAELHKLRARIYLYIDFPGIVLVYPRAQVQPWSLVQVPTSMMETHQWLIKRFLDLLLTSLFFTISLPVMAVIAIAIKLDSRGPIIFKQWRIGENGRPFMLYKFRSMVDGAEAEQERVNRWTPDGELIHKFPDDPRITPVGRILRRWSLDELPELWNVLRGDMSLVGPRPELPWIVERYKPDYYRRFMAPPGLTGIWQISERGLKPMHLAVGDDLYYVENYSLWLDLWILLKTPFAVLRGRGAF